MRTVLLRTLTVIVASALPLLVMEVGLRVYHGELLDFTSELPETVHRTEKPTSEYDPRLGWIPTPGRFGDATVLDDHRRSSCPEIDSMAPGVLALGDSFTFGDEVGDADTWPAGLARRLETGVWNAGAPGYGVDQAVLRGMDLLDELDVRWVVLAFIQDDMNRAQYVYYHAWKPLFRVVADSLVLDHVSVPRAPPPEPALAGTRRVLGYSLLASALARRVAPGWWYFGAIAKEHDEGEEVTVRLATRLHRAATARDVGFLAVTLPTDERIGPNDRIERVARALRDEGVPVLDLVARSRTLANTDSALTYRPGGHFTASANRWVADRIAEALTEG